MILSTGGVDSRGVCMARGGGYTARGVHGGGCIAGGCAWLGVCAWLGGVHGRGACMAGGGMRGRGCAWLGAVHGGGGGHVWHAFPPGRYYGYGIPSMSGRYASYWNAFLLLNASTSFNFVFTHKSEHNLGK